MKRNAPLTVIIASLVISFAAPLHAETKGDRCAKEGLSVRNLTMIDLWYKKKDGDCEIWRHNHILGIKPKESIDIFSDMNCTTLYCTNSPTYKKYRSVDKNRNCRVRVLPDCSLSDM